MQTVLKYTCKVLISCPSDERGEQMGYSDHYELSSGRERFDKAIRCGLSHFKNPYGSDPVSAFLINGKANVTTRPIQIQSESKTPIYTEILIVDGKIMAEIRQK